MSRYKKKHSPPHTCCGHQSSLICFIHLLRSMASSLFNYMHDSLFYNVSQVFFGLPLGLALSTSYSIHFFTQSLSSFRSTCPYLSNMFCCSTKVMSSNPSLSTIYLELYLVTSPHTSILPFSSLPSEVPFHFPFLQARSHFHATYCFACNFCTNFLSLSNDISLLVSNGNNCLNLFHPYLVAWFIAVGLLQTLFHVQNDDTQVLVLVYCMSSLQ